MLAVIKIVEKIPKDSVSRVIIEQLIRSITSIAANLIEAKAASSKKDYINFYHHALKSANESKLWLCLLRDMDKINQDIIKSKLLNETNEIANILASSIITMKNKKI